MRQKTCAQLNQSNYQFTITSTNFANSNTRTQKRNKTELKIQPRTNTINKNDDTLQRIRTGQLQAPHDKTEMKIRGYGNNSAHELHSTISNGLSRMDQQLTQTNPTMNTNELATLLKSIQNAYLTLANITFQGETEGNTHGSLDTNKGDGREREEATERNTLGSLDTIDGNGSKGEDANIIFQGETMRNIHGSLDTIGGDSSEGEEKKKKKKKKKGKMPKKAKKKKDNTSKTPKKDKKKKDKTKVTPKKDKTKKDKTKE
jgi:hypothetical protein